jgi:uncharacterized RDD family membrane protein YckC
MTTAADQYIQRVIANMPRATPLRAQIAMELRGHISERVDRGQPLEDVLRQLGDPVKLAESYLAAVPLVAASFWRRAAAKLVDGLTLLVAAAPIAVLVARLIDEPAGLAVGAFVAFLLATVCFGLYTALAEWYFGATVGKHLLGLQVVRESGARIGFGQALVRQLPQWLQVFWIDILFSIFTERKQRAFELLSRTRVVAAEARPAGDFSTVAAGSC